MRELNKRGKNWCFTLNNWTEDQARSIVSLAKCTCPTETECSVNGAASACVTPSVLTYLIMGKEVGESGTPHLQGFLALHKKKTGLQLKNLMPEGCVIIKSKGSALKNKAYCSKDGEIYAEIGIIPAQGTRTDLANLKMMIDEKNATIEDVADEYFGHFLRYKKNITDYIMMKREVKKTWFPEIWIYWGNTGLGKTRKVYDENELKDIWVWNHNHRFFQGYLHHDVAVFDDFYGDMNLAFMLKLIDRYPFTVNIKNGRCNWQPKKVYFTSNIDPRHWQGWLEEPQEKKDAFFRRIRDSGGGIIRFPNLL